MSLSEIRQLSYDVVNDLYNTAMEVSKKKFIFKIIGFLKPYMDRIILKEASEEELKKVVWRQKERLDKYFKKLDVAQEIFKSNLNDDYITKNLEKLPDYSQLKKLI